MSDIKFLIARFFRRFHWFLAAAVAISTVAVTVAMTLPPAYESEVRLIVESKQIPDALARSTVSTSAVEQLQIIQQRLMTRENLLDIADEFNVVRGQQDMSADEIVKAMRAQTRIRRNSGRNEATVMSIQFEAPTGRAAAGVLNAYLSLILEQAAEFRTERAESTLEFFEQQVERLQQDLDLKGSEILQFKNANVDALPETLDFRLSKQAQLQDRLTQIETDIIEHQNERNQLIRLSEAAKQIGADPNKSVHQLSPRERRLSQLQQELSEARVVYSESSPKVQRILALIGQLEQDEQVNPNSEEPEEATAPEEIAPTRESVLLSIQLEQIDAKIALLETQKADAETEIEQLSGSISKTPTNAIVLDTLERDYSNLQGQYNQAVAKLSEADTGERIEFLSHGQRITVIEPPVAPTEPTKPDRKKLAIAGVGAGILAGLVLVYLLEFLNRTPRRPEDIVARFDVMPIATIPYVATRRQLVLERGFKILVTLAILLGIPAAIWTVHEYWMPLDVFADKLMNQIGIRW